MQFTYLLLPYPSYISETLDNPFYKVIVQLLLLLLKSLHLTLNLEDHIFN